MDTRFFLSRLISPLLCGLVLCLGYLVYGSTGHDDPHINFWSAFTLLEHGEILNYNGERVEQTTSLLLDILTVLISVVGRLNLVTSGYLVDIIASFACCLLVAALARKFSPTLAHWPTLLLLSCASYLLWTFGSMGSALATVCLLATVTVWARWIQSAHVTVWQGFGLVSVTLALLLARPEMFLVAIALAGWALLFCLHNAPQRCRCLQLLAVSIVLAALLALWRKWYFSVWLPLPVFAKQGGSFSEHLSTGYHYVLFNSLLNLVVPLALISALCWYTLRKRPVAESTSRFMLLAAGTMIIYLGFVWTSGGDWMQAGRFFMPILPFACLIIASALALLPQRWLAHSVLALLCTIQFSGQYFIVKHVSHGIPAWVQYRLAPEHMNYSIFEKLNQEHLRDMAVVDHLQELISQLQPRVTGPLQLLSGQAGMVYYYTAQKFPGRVYFRDMHGLVESSLTLCPLLKEVPRNAQGLSWTYEDFFTRLPALRKECGIVPPDIIYDLNSPNVRLTQSLAQQGYMLVHKELGEIVINTTSLPYNRLLSPNLIFVHQRLLPFLAVPNMRIIDYSTLTLQTRLKASNH